MAKILILESRKHEKLAVACLTAVRDIAKANKLDIEIVSVHNIFDLPCAASMSLESQEYDGVIVLGCAISERTIETESIYREVTRCFSDLSVHYALPIGFGIITAQSITDAESHAVQAARDAALSCVELLKLKSQLGFSTHEQFIRYNN